MRFLARLARTTGAQLLSHRSAGSFVLLQPTEQLTGQIQRAVRRGQRVHEAHQ